jgi:23S rRNA pseudouridine1911/1915/1917 synthase
LVHRLDRETSGLVLVAKTQAVFEDLRRQFQDRQVKKYYWALVWGVTPSRGSVDYAITHARGDNRRMRVVVGLSKLKKEEKSWEACTRYRRLSADGKFSLLQIQMRTGVMHQIRVHLATVDHPIVGDAIYGLPGADTLGLKRHFLHAYRMEFVHPVEQCKVAVNSPLPRELKSVLSGLKVAI